MPTRYIQKAKTADLLGCANTDPQPGNVASIGFDSTRSALVVNGDGVTAHVVTDQEAFRITINANSVTTPVFIADKAYQVVSVTEVHSVVSSSGTLVVEKDTGTTAPGSGTSLFASGSLDLTSAINVPVTKALTATVATLKLAAGDRISFVFGGTLTGLVGAVTVVIRPI